MAEPRRAGLPPRRRRVTADLLDAKGADSLRELASVFLTAGHVVREDGPGEERGGRWMLAISREEVPSRRPRVFRVDPGTMIAAAGFSKVNPKLHGGGRG